MNYTFLLLSIHFFFLWLSVVKILCHDRKTNVRKKCINDERNLKRTNKRLFTKSTNIILERFVSVFFSSFTFCPHQLICFNLFNQSIVFGWRSFGHVHACDVVFSPVVSPLLNYLSLFFSLSLDLYIHQYIYMYLNFQVFSPT